MIRIEKTTVFLAEKLNWVAAAAIVLMMLLTTLDVLLRILRLTIPGTYEIVGLLGTLVISFSLAYTSVEKGHIAVEFLVQRLSSTAQGVIQAINALTAVLLFAVVTWQSIVYALDLMRSGEVSQTLELPVYPFVFGVAAGCGCLCPVLLVEFIRALKKVGPRQTAKRI